MKLEFLTGPGILVRFGISRSGELISLEVGLIGAQRLNEGWLAYLSRTEAITLGTALVETGREHG